MAPFDKHIFVCCNRRELTNPRGCCDPAGEEKLQKAFKKSLAEHGVRRVRANKSGCLDQCEKGPSVVVYPDNIWYGRVTEADVDEIVEQHIIGGRPVVRLLMPDTPPTSDPQ